jgi:hypothetical protein
VPELDELTILTAWAEAVSEAVAHAPERVDPMLEAAGHQASGRMTDQRWFVVQGVDDLRGVIVDLLQGFVGQHIRVGPGLFNRFRIVGPVQCERRVTRLREEGQSVRQATRQHPQAVDQPDRRLVRAVGRLDLTTLPLGD